VVAGKEVLWGKFEGLMKQREKYEIPEPSSQNVSGAPPFKMVKHRDIKRSSVKADFSTENESQVRSSIVQNKPMRCFSRVHRKDVEKHTAALQTSRHLDTGKHQKILELKTLHDRAKREYSS